MKIKITADSTCDLTKELAEKYDIDVLPLYIVINGQSYKDGIEIDNSKIFDYVDNEVSKGAKMPSSSAINVDDYIGYFTPLSKEYDAVIHINLSSGFSSCFQNATLASKEFENVFVVDSKNLTTGSGMLAIMAREYADSGLSASEIVEKLNALTSKVDASFVIDRMDYLQKGGRCSALLAFAATVAKIKPQIQVVDGKMTVGKKYMGTFKIALKRYIQDKLSSPDSIDTKRIFITSPACSDETYAMVRDEIKNYIDFDEVYETKAGCTVSTHCGPETLGIIFLKK